MKLIFTKKTQESSLEPMCCRNVVYGWSLEAECTISDIYGHQKVQDLKCYFLVGLPEQVWLHRSPRSTGKHNS